jgi:hypothetical protein
MAGMCGISAKGGVGSCNGQVGRHSRIGEGDDGIEGCNVNEGGRCSYVGSDGSVNDYAEGLQERRETSKAGQQ